MQHPVPTTTCKIYSRNISQTITENACGAPYARVLTKYTISIRAEVTGMR